MGKKTEIGRATEQQIEAWKNKHKDVYEYTQQDEQGNVHFTYVRKPTLTDISFAAKFADTDPIKSSITMFTNCRLGGSDTVVEDDEMKQGIVKKISRLFKAVEAEEKAIAERSIDEADGSDWYRKGNALIRRAFFVNPESLSRDEWRERYVEAVWLDARDKKFLIEILKKLYNPKGNEN